MAAKNKPVLDKKILDVEGEQVNEEPVDFSVFDADGDPIDETETNGKDVTRFRIAFHKDTLGTLKAMEKASQIERDTIIDMAIQALLDVDEENLTMYYQIASARRAVNLFGLKLNS